MMLKLIKYAYEVEYEKFSSLMVCERHIESNLDKLKDISIRNH